MTEQHDESEPGLLGTLAPYLLGAVVASCAIVFSALRIWPERLVQGGGYMEAPAIVAFDVVRYTNAQRAVASAFLKPNTDPQAVNEILMNLSDRTRKAIQEEAGPNTLVVVKQSVVQGQVKDITEAVLTRLHLPIKEVPTSHGADYVIDLAPTMLMQVPTLRKFTDPVKRPNPQNTDEVLP